MRKGASTRGAVLEDAVDLASVVGLSGLSIGHLADHAGLSKSGLFAHFGSKEALQVGTLKCGVDRFTDQVVRPALKLPRGRGRIQAIFDGWLRWASGGGPPGGCLFIAASIEFDDRQAGPVRDYLVETQTDWLGLLSTCARYAVEAGDFRSDLDCDQFAHEFNSILLGYQQSHRLLRHARARERATNAYHRLIRDANHDTSSS